MAKKNNKLLMAGVVIAFILIFGKGSFLGAVLPAGQYNSNLDCTFITNVDPLDSPWEDYKDSPVWITVDANNDGILDSFGYDGFTNLWRPDQYNLLMEDINSYGDDLFVRIGGSHIAVVKADRSFSARYFPGKPATDNAVTSCDGCVADCTNKQCGSNGCGGSCGTCTSGFNCEADQCVEESCIPTTTCSGVCGQESDGCGAFINCGSCSSGSSCVSGSCIAQTCSIDNINFGWTEINQAISKWISGG